ncbi:hypothetical protein [Neobacillus drentensis]|uniref:hypothetical protein n=1 Tax=Neobacillus drentensis TaxID=220684 RepID=UPI002FFF4396
MQITNNDIFYCYNKRLFTFIREIKGIDCLTIGKHPVTNKIYSMFVKSKELQMAIDEYKSLTKK